MCATTARPLSVLGIDISKPYFDVTLIRISKTGKVYSPVSARFDNTPEGYKRLKTGLTGRHVKQVHACLEATGRYGDCLAMGLHTHGHTVSVVNPAIIHAYAHVHLRRNKTDARDADLIARYGPHERPQPWTPPTQATLDLQALLKRLADLRAIRQQESSRLASIVPCPQVADFIQCHSDFLDTQIAELEMAARSLTQTTPSLAAQFKLLLTIPGIGPLTAMRLVAFDLLRFADADAAVAMAGLNPSQHQSGTSCKRESRLSKRGHADIGHALYMPALTALTCNPVVRDLAARLSAKSKHVMVIIGAAMRKLLRLAYGVLKSNTAFDPHFAPYRSQAC